MSELQQFIDDLEQELVAGIARHNPATAGDSARPNRIKPILAVTLTLAAVVVGVFGIPKLLDTQPAAAEAIAITQLQDRVEIRIVDVIKYPDAVVSKLQEELGLQAEMVAFPAHPTFVGTVGSVGNIGPVEPETIRDLDGAVELVILPKGFSGTLIIEYGREAEAGEFYVLSGTDRRCEIFYGLTPGESLNRLQDFGGSLRFQMVSADGSVEVDADPLDIPDTYTLTDLLPLSVDSYLVTYAENPAAEGVAPNCQ